MKRMPKCLEAAAVLLLLAGGDARAARMFVAMGGEGGSHGDINLIVRQVRVAPVRAHVGDPIRIEAVIENHAEWRGTVTARVYANRKPVASQLFTYDVSHGPGALYRESFVWNTAGAAPGEYRIRAEAFDWGDTSPFDNYLDVSEPVTLLSAGAEFPAGRPGGGEAVAVDPRWRPVPWSREPAGRNPSAASGIERETANGRRQ